MDLLSEMEIVTDRVLRKCAFFFSFLFMEMVKLNLKFVSLLGIHG